MRVAWTAVAASLMVAAGCKRAVDTDADTRVLGSAPSAAPRPREALRDSSGAPIPAPTLPRGVQPQYALVTDSHAVALWVQDGRVMATRYRPYAGWEPAAELEGIEGRASLLRVAGNGRGVAMAVWRHNVGQIDSLRYSRFREGQGWSRPDVIAMALPRAPQPGKTAGPPVEAAAPQIELDADGNARAQWLSGYEEHQVQVSTYVPNEGWSRPLDLPVQVPTRTAEAPAPAGR